MYEIVQNYPNSSKTLHNFYKTLQNFKIKKHCTHNTKLYSFTHFSKRPKYVQNFVPLCKTPQDCTQLYYFNNTFKIYTQLYRTSQKYTTLYTTLHKLTKLYTHFTKLYTTIQNYTHIQHSTNLYNTS